MHARTQYAPLTLEEQRFAELNHELVLNYLRRRKLELNEWYDVVIFRYLLSVKKNGLSARSFTSGNFPLLQCKTCVRL